MNISVNGISHPLKEDTSVSDFLKTRNIDTNSVIVELNKNIVKNCDYQQIFFKDKDQLEILRFVGGG